MTRLIMLQHHQNPILRTPFNPAGSYTYHPVYPIDNDNDDTSSASLSNSRDDVPHKNASSWSIVATCVGLLAIGLVVMFSYQKGLWSFDAIKEKNEGEDDNENEGNEKNKDKCIRKAHMRRRMERNMVHKAATVDTRKQLPLDDRFLKMKQQNLSQEISRYKGEEETKKQLKMTPVIPRKDHPLEVVRKKMDTKNNINKYRYARGIKRGRAGGNKPPLPPKLESYDMTHDLPYNEIKVYNVPEDGDCLFHCFVQILDGIHLKRTVHNLREIVARSIGKKEFEFLYEIYNMAKQQGDVNVISDYSYMEHVSDLRTLRRSIMTPYYFGDEMAVKALEYAFPVQCMILRINEQNRIELARRYNEDEEQQKPWFALLLLNIRSQHYELMCYRDKTIMRREELPSKIIRLLDQQKLELELKSSTSQ